MSTIGASTGFGTEGEGRGGGDVPRPANAGTVPEGEARATPEDVIERAKAAAAEAAANPAPPKRSHKATGRGPGRPRKDGSPVGSPRPGPDGIAKPMTPEEETAARAAATPPAPPPPVIEWSPELCGDIMTIPFRVYARFAVPEPARKAYKLEPEIRLDLGVKLKALLEHYRVADIYAREIHLAVATGMCFWACQQVEIEILEKLTKEAEERKKAAAGPSASTATA